jgi:hypothetical protein
VYSQKSHLLYKINNMKEQFKAVHRASAIDEAMNAESEFLEEASINPTIVGKLLPAGEAKYRQDVKSGLTHNWSVVSKQWELGGLSAVDEEYRKYFKSR